MAAAQATSGLEKKRVSKAVKRKAKKVLEAPADDSEDEKTEEKPDEQPAARAEADAAPEPEKVRRAKKPLRKTKANRLEEMQAEAEKEPKEPRGVIYVGHIPEGFFEPQMRKFFSQFGKVLRLRISRSKKTARSKGYAFVEFEELGVAKIVAETMQGYLLFDKTLVCHLMPKDKQHPKLFKNCRRRMVNLTQNRRKAATKAYNDRPTVEVNGEQVPHHTLRQVDKRVRHDKKLTSVLANAGVDYDVSGADEDAKGSVRPAAPAPAAPAASVSAPKKKKRKVAA